MQLSNGATSCEVMALWAYRGNYYIALMETRNVAGGNSSFSVGDALTGNGVSVIISAVNTAETNNTANNFFDVIADFRGSSFSKITMIGGYCGGVFGENLHSSFLVYDNSFDPTSLNIKGLGIAESGSTLSLYRQAENNPLFANITSQFVNFQRKLYMQRRLYEGHAYATTLASSPNMRDIYTFSDESTDKYLNEGCMYDVTAKTNYAGCYASLRVYVRGNNATIVSDNSAILDCQITGNVLQMRQQAQPNIQIVINSRRV
ncbi:hypothetical protein [Pectobacterium versatile]|uniref:hypothetical protein n=1 Tax=Pectobacterium versatile TaxID=2488639 RepID=UPI001F1877F7|nr:hypothetical protein [Pectobacterium versatile]